MGGQWGLFSGSKASEKSKARPIADNDVLNPLPLATKAQVLKQASHSLAELVTSSPELIVLRWFASCPSIACVDYWRPAASGELWEHFKTERK